MKKRVLAIFCMLLMFLAGCSVEQEPIAQVTTSSTTSTTINTPLEPIEANNQYLRINLKMKTLEDMASQISADTNVIITTDYNLPTQMPIYEINDHAISEEEFQQVQENVKISESATDSHNWTLNGNKISGNFANYNTGTATMSDDELEAMAQETFNQLTLLEGDYVYSGICGWHTVEDSEGIQTTRKMVSFCRVLDGARIIGNDQCDMWFDDSGLVAIYITLFDYKQIGAIDLVPLAEAEANIKSPDMFKWESDDTINNTVDTLAVNQSYILLYNQLSRGCTVLQPVYVFKGTATSEDGTQAEFSSRVIAIPESYTYEDE